MLIILPESGVWKLLENKKSTKCKYTNVASSQIFSLSVSVNVEFILLGSSLEGADCTVFVYD